MEEEKITIHEKEDRNKKLQNTLRIFGVAGFLIGVIALIGYKLNNPEVNITRIFIIGFFILVVGSLLFFGLQLSQKWRKLINKEESEDKIPPASSEEEILERLQRFITNTNPNGFQNHIKEYSSREFNINKNKIYCFDVKLLYKEQMNSVDQNKVYVIINANYIKNIPTILPGNTHPTVVYKAINSASSQPSEDPIVEETKSSNVLTGIEVHHKKTTPKSKKDKEKKEDKKDIE